MSTPRYLASDRRVTGNALVIGMGSIGSRHARLLGDDGYRVSAVSARTDLDCAVHPTLAEALRGAAPDIVVIANPTSAHGDALEELAAANYTGHVLVEKPLFDQPRELPRHNFSRACVGYNLRHHPVVRALHAAISGQTLIAVSMYAGQYLPDWRPGTDHRRSYSSSRGAGGGVLRDLSHELDLALWLFGSWRRLTALGGRVSGRLTVDSDDCWAVLLEMARCPMVSVHLNYHDRSVRRVITVTTEHHSYVADLIACMLQTDGVSEAFSCGRDDTYRGQLAALTGDTAADLCSLQQGLSVVELIATIETAAAQRTWAAA